MPRPDRRSPPEGAPPLLGPIRYFERSSGWGLGDVVVGFVAAQLLALVVELVLVSASHSDATDPPLWIQYTTELPLWVGLAGVSIWATRAKGDGPVVELGVRLKWWDVPLGLAAGLFGQLVLVGLVYWPIYKVLGHTLDVGQVADNLTEGVHGLGWQIVVFVMLVLCAPAVEELYFRGLTQGALLKQRRLGRVNPWMAIGLTAVFFALGHGEPVQLPALFAFALVLGALAWSTKRLGPSFFAHLSFNAVTAATLLWGVNLPMFTPHP